MKRLRMTCLTAMAVACLGAAQLSAAIISGSLSETIVESRTGGLNFAAYSDSGDGFPNSWSNSSAKSSAPGVTTGVGSRFNSNSGIGGANVWFQVAPTLPTAGGTYEVYATVTGASGAISATAGVIVTGGSGLPATTNAFSVDAVTQPGNAWNLIGTLTLDPGVATPSVRFTEDANSNRFYADAVLFAEVGVVPEPATLALAGLSMIGLFAARRRT